MQSKVALQLDRTATTLNTLHIQYFTDAQIVLPSADKKQVRNNWTIISRDNKTRTEHTVLVGGTVELECQWILADGSKVRAPYISEDGRITVLGTGTLTLRTADTFDTGLYHCIGTSYNDADALTFRITVLDPYVEHNSVNGAQLSASVGSTLDLPCTAKGMPPPQIMWIMPDNIFLTAPYYGSRIVVHKNGTLEIRNIRPSDTAEFICVARNDGGESMLVVQLEVVEMLRRPTFKNPFNEKIIAKPGKATTLNCSVDGNPPPDIKFWFLNSVDRSKKQPSVVREKYLHDGRRWLPTRFTLMTGLVK
uniref:Immunoglobulin superfamily member 10 n=1 Tax=Strix occidentalis caurina TaxID=311401 RepID=A0A8D0EXR8_STROC